MVDVAKSPDAVVAQSVMSFSASVPFCYFPRVFMAVFRQTRPRAFLELCQPMATDRTRDTWVLIWSPTISDSSMREGRGCVAGHCDAERLIFRFEPVLFQVNTSSKQPSLQYCRVLRLFAMFWDIVLLFARKFCRTGSVL